MARKYSDNESFRQYAIPYNFIDESKMFGGMFKTRNFVEGVILSAFFIGPILLLPVSSLVVKACLLIIVGMPPIIFGVVGLNNDALSTFVLYFMKYRKTKRKVYFNSKVKEHSEVDIEEGLKAELPREKVMKLFGPIINKRAADTADEGEGAFVFDDDIDNAMKKRKEKNRKIDYSTDNIIYEGYVLSEKSEYPVELDILASEIMKNEEYESEIVDEEPMSGEELIFEYDDIEIIKGLDEISREMGAVDIEIEAEEPSEYELMLQKEQDEHFELLDNVEILEIVVPELANNSERNTINESPEIYSGEEQIIEPYSGKNGIEEQLAEQPDKTLVEPETTAQNLTPAIDIFNLGIKKITEIEEALKSELQVKESSPEVDESEEEQDEEDSVMETEGIHKRKRKRKRRKNKNTISEGGEPVE